MTRVAEVCTKIIRWSFFALLIIVPAIWLPWNYELFEFNKMMVTYAVTAVIACAWITKWIAEKKITIAKTPLDIPIALFFLSQLLATFFSMDPHVSWFGYYSRFNGGMWSIVSYIILYYAFVSNFISDKRQVISDKENKKPEKQIISSFSLLPSRLLPLIYTALATAFLISLWGIAESFGIDKHLWVQDVQHRVFSTLGQPNWLAAYLVALLPLSMALALRSLLAHQPGGGTLWKRSVTPGFMIWVTVSAVFFWTLLLTRSRSGYLGFLVADTVLLLLLIWKLAKTNQLKTFFPWATVIHGVFFAIFFFSGTKVGVLDAWTFEGIRQRLSTTEKAVTQPAESEQHVGVPGGTLLETGISESTDIRKHVWNGAIAAWRSSTKTFLFGTGTETFAFAFYQFRPKEHNMTSEWDFLYNKAHNEYLNYLATTGVLGLGSYVVLLLVFVTWFASRMLHGQNRESVYEKFTIESLSIGHWSLVIGLFAGWISILVTNFWGFSVVIMQIFLFLLPAMVMSLREQEQSHITLSLPRSLSAAATAFMGVTAVILVGNILVGWWADTLFATGYRYNRAENFAESLPSLELAVRLRGGEPFYHDELATALAGKTVLLLGEKNTTAAAELAKRAIFESDRALRQSPKNVNFWKTRTKIYYSFSSFDPGLTREAITALEQGYLLSPNDPKIMYNLAILYGRAGDSDKAIAMLQKGIDVKPDYRDLYYGLYVFYNETDKKKEAKTILEEYLTRVNPEDKEFKDLAVGIK